MDSTASADTSVKAKRWWRNAKSVDMGWLPGKDHVCKQSACPAHSRASGNRDLGPRFLADERELIPLLRHRHHIARARDTLRPRAIEVGDQLLEGVGGKRGVEPAFGEVIDRVMHARLQLAPEAPGLLAFENLDRPRQVVGRIPMVEFIAQGRGDDGMDEEEGVRQVSRFRAGRCPSRPVSDKTYNTTTNYSLCQSIGPLEY